MAELPINFTVRDLVGAVLPGMVLAVEFFTMKDLLESFTGKSHSQYTSIFPSTFDVAIGIAEDRTMPFYVGFIVCSLILGYISNVFPTHTAERLTYFICKYAPLKSIREIHDRATASKCLYESRKCSQSKKHEFPYEEYHRSLPYFPMIEEIIERNFRLKPEDIPGGSTASQPSQGIFSACKRILKMSGNKLLSERVQHIEAQCRMLASLFIASLINLILILVAMVVNIPDQEDSYLRSGSNSVILVFEQPLLLWLGWLAVSYVSTVVIAYAFQYRRIKEVESVYAYMLLWDKDQSRRKHVPAG